MCGIIAYSGKKQAAPILLGGLKRLEYRGYDSAGIAVQSRGELAVVKRKGEVSRLAGDVKAEGVQGQMGIAHTRWATHGEPSQVNAHPHIDCGGRIAIAHNGIIENYKALKEMLLGRGHRFRSQTDSEVLAHLVEDFLRFVDEGTRPRETRPDKSGRVVARRRSSGERSEELAGVGKAEFCNGKLQKATRAALNCVEGTFGLAVMCAGSGKIIAARRGSPLVIGVGEEENFVASDVSALMEHTKKVVYLDENELAVIDKESYEISDFDGNHVSKEVKEVQWSLAQIEKGGHKFFMEKEIFEQPEAVRNNLRGRLKAGQVKLSVDVDISRLGRIVITACGTSWHAALVGRYLIERLARIPVEVDYASEFRYRNPIIDENTLFIAISQSGETADTLAALRLAKEKGAQTLGIVNVVGSTVAREVDSGIYLHAGPEIGVASTKAFTAELSSLFLLTFYLRNQLEGTPPKENPSGLSVLTRRVEELPTIPPKMQTVLENTEPVKKVANHFKDAHDFLYLARGINFPIALEGALKLKELSYAHAEGYPAAEMKHGPIALIEEGTPVVFIAVSSRTLEKTISNMEEVKARGGEIIAVVDRESKKKIGALAAHKFVVPQTPELLSPLLAVLPLQLLSYYIADFRGLNLDKPRNLAKSVTVE